MDGYMNVVLCLENSQHADALARRLVQLTDRIHITIAAEEPESGSEWAKKENFGDDNMLIVNDELAAACSSASALLEVLKERYMAKTGRRLCCAADGGPVIIGVGSAAGGSGTTAAAVTLARILAGKLSGETALIFSGGSGNTLDYLENIEKCDHKTTRELDYMLTHNIETDIMKYIIKDRYGPLAAVSAAAPRLLLERLQAICNVEAAVLDLGSGGRTADCHIYIETAACGDLRAAAFEERAAAIPAAENRILLLNKTAAINREGRLFCLPLDSESFRRVQGTGSRIEIAMDGIFTAAMRQAAEEVKNMIDNMK